MSSPDGFALAARINESLLSYLASALPVGNHTSQRELGEALHDRWRTDLFAGPFVEFMPAYEKRQSLSDAFGDTRDKSSPDYRFGRLMVPPGVNWGTVEPHVELRRIRDKIWPKGSPAARQEAEGTRLSQLYRQPLYGHQWDAFEQLVRRRRSTVVATSTGSGKTECFFLPLLYRLLAESDERRRTPGVRALLVYPLNALVEDQMHRLRQTLFWLNFLCSRPGESAPSDHLARPITFGRYTGNTPTKPQDHDPDRQPSDEAMEPLGELVYRIQMQQTPPDILITNFTMLEYMLLRGDDQRLFHPADAFELLVLDEVHTYSGTQGMEVALLIRRLRSFLMARGLKEPFLSVGTSATLPSGPAAKEQAAQFATTLFGVPFERDDIIRPDPRPWRSQHGGAPLVNRDVLQAALLRLPKDCPVLHRAFLGKAEPTDGNRSMPDDELRSFGVIVGVREGEPEEDAEQGTEGWERVGRLLEGSDALRLLRSAIAGGSHDCVRLSALAQSLFGAADENATAATTTLLQIVAALQGGVRFHYFVDEPASAQVCLAPTCAAPRDGWWRRLFVLHHTRCRHCEAFAYGILLCRRCGYVYLEGWRQGATLYPERDQADPPTAYDRILFRPKVVAPALDTSATERTPCEERTLCLECGRYMVADSDPHFAMAASHGCDPAHFLPILAWTPGNGVLEECLFCEQTWIEGMDVVTPPTASVYAVASVVVEELARSLTEPGQARTKLVSFSDSRQQAAQLAYRFQKTNREFTLRQLIHEILRGTGDGHTRTSDLLDELYRRVRRDRRLTRLLLDDEDRLNDKPALQRTLATLLLKEAVSAFLTLESQGLARVEVAPAVLAGAASLQTGDRFFFDRLAPEGREAFVRFLLDWSLRFRYAVDSPRDGADIDWAHLVGTRVYRKVSVFSRRGGAPDEVAFAVSIGTPLNRPFNLCNRVVQRLTSAAHQVSYGLQDLRQVLRSVWDGLLVPNALSDNDPRAIDAPLLNHGSDETDTARLKLNFDALLWRATGDEERVYRCDACGRIAMYSIEGVCPMRDCRGTLQPARAGDLDGEKFGPVRHYRRLVTRQSIHPLRVEEHTAQVAPTRRQAIEREFRSNSDDSVDVICGSTTFELGIDLGSIQAVFLSNLPPRVANYRQRAGRAGRRPGMTPFILGYVRQRPHDQYFWKRLEEFVAGPVPVPRLALSSHEVVSRHGYAVLMSHLLARYQAMRQGAMPLEGPPIKDFLSFAVAPVQRTWMRREVRSATSAMSREVLQVFADVSARPAIQALVDAFDERLDALRDSAVTLRGGDGAISVLSDYGVLPSYAFPLYVDELRLNREARDRPPRVDLKLQRDRRLSLIEYMPGRVVVAGKTVIRSQGVWAGFERRPFRFCPDRDCLHLDFGTGGAAECTVCGKPRRLATAIVPKEGFFGRVEKGISSANYELTQERGETYFDPANEPPPVYLAAGRGLEVAVVGGREMEVSSYRPRMRQLNPRPLSAVALDLVAREERDVAAPHAPPVRCLARPAPEEKGKADRFHLMHEFTTDIARVRVLDNEVGSLLCSSPAFRTALEADADPNRRAFHLDCLRRTLGEALSLATSLMLDIDPSEIGVTFHPGGGTSIEREIILFDTAPGGAGYSQQVLARCREVFERATEIVSGCGCGDSCYSCLRTYHNQVFHTRLNRLWLADGLRALVAANW